MTRAEDAAGRLRDRGYLVTDGAPQAPGETFRRCPHCKQTWPLPEICECGHGIAMHGISSKGKRTACSVVDGTAGPCGCTAYTEAEAPDGT